MGRATRGLSFAGNAGGWRFAAGSSGSTRRAVGVAVSLVRATAAYNHHDQQNDQSTGWKGSKEVHAGLSFPLGIRGASSGLPLFATNGPSDDYGYISVPARSQVKCIVGSRAVGSSRPLASVVKVRRTPARIRLDRRPRNTLRDHPHTPGIGVRFGGWSGGPELEFGEEDGQRTGVDVTDIHDLYLRFASKGTDPAVQLRPLPVRVACCRPIA